MISCTESVFDVVLLEKSFHFLVVEVQVVIGEYPFRFDSSLE